ncbi:MAG: hypothetical protein L6R39_007441 [Caloplaca ligustica]|nr:MAG: hypothetical protein L6R39_007441 [Caloplaca ligustica]
MTARFLGATAKAEEKDLEHAGAEETQDSLYRLSIHKKDQLEKDPAVSNQELNQVSEGLGEEAKEFEGKGGLGATNGRQGGVSTPDSDKHQAPAMQKEPPESE